MTPFKDLSRLGRMAWLRAALLLAWVCAAGLPPAVAQGVPEQRLALVIGNAAYKASPLANPVNDARLMETSLKEAGFTVIKAENASMRDMRRLVRDFGDRLKAAGGVGLFYFAGHGVQVRGENFLVSTDSDIRNEDEVADDAINANLVLEKMQSAGNRMNLVILDACRNNPFAVKSRSASNGLATMSAPSGSLVAYSTSPGSVASDGSGQNGLYTEHLAKVIRQPGLPVEEVFKQVRSAVRRDSNNQQTPWENTALEGQFYFKTPVQAAAPAAAVARPTAGATSQAEMVLWDNVKGSLSPAEVQAYLSRFPTGLFADVAKARIAALMGSSADKASAERIASERAANERAAAEASLKAAEAAIEQNRQLIASRTDPTTLDMMFWENVKSSTRPAELEAYLQQFPKGMFVGLARVRIDDMKTKPAAVAPSAVVAAVTPAASVAALVASVPMAQVAVGEVLGTMVVRDELTKLTQLTEVSVKERTAQATTYSTGDVIGSDGQVLAARLGAVMVKVKRGSLWKFPLQSGASGEAELDVQRGSNSGGGTVHWKVLPMGSGKLAVEAKLGYKLITYGVVSWYGTWLGSFVDRLPLPASYSIVERSQFGSFDNHSAEFSAEKAVTATTLLPGQTAVSEVLGTMVVRDELTKLTQSTEVRVTKRTPQATAYSTGDVIGSDGQVLAARLGSFVVKPKKGTLWKFPLQSGTSGEAELDVQKGSAIVLGGTVQWKVLSMSAGKLVVEAKFGYKINASVSTAWYGTWLGTFVDQLPFAASFSFSEKSQLGLFDNLTAEFNPKK